CPHLARRSQRDRGVDDPTGGELDLRLRDGRHLRELDLEGVPLPRRQRRDAELALAVGDGGLHDAQRRVGDRDAGARKRRSILVDDDAPDPRGGLGESRGLEGEEGAAGDEDEESSLQGHWNYPPGWAGTTLIPGMHRPLITTVPV